MKLSTMRKLIIGITIGFLAASTLAWAVTVRFPSVLKVKGIVFVDEAGNVLGGATPTTVDVVNMPTSLDVNITNLPSTGSESSGEFFETELGFVDGTGTRQWSQFIVPAGNELRLTDIHAKDYGYCQLERRATDNSLVTELTFNLGGGAINQLGTPIVISEGEMLRGMKSSNSQKCMVYGLLVPTS